MERKQLLKKGILGILLLISGSSSAFAETPGKENAQKIIDSSYRTLKVSNPDNFMAPPIIRLGSEDAVRINFDQLAYDREELAATLIHCNADWTPSPLQDTEFLDSFNFEDIEDYSFSSNTFQHFVNYQLDIPSEHLAPLLSGNYLLKVFRRNDPEDVVLQARFKVVEPLSGIDAKVTTRTDRGSDNNWQQLELNVDLKQMKVSNPYSDLFIKITQNSDPESVRTLRTPLRVEGQHLIYAHQPDLIFPALNEFRRFETVRATYPGMHVDSVRFHNNRYHAYLTTDADRSEREYLYDRTQNGRFLIREYNSTESDLAADYIDVHFSLDFPELIGADIYVQGEFTNYLLDDSNRMEYDRDTGLYRLTMPLKQGSYNYRYTAAKRDKDGNPSDLDPHPEVVEGNHYETRNEYLVEVWYRPPGARADRLIGTSTIYSN